MSAAASSREQIFSKLFHAAAARYWDARKNPDGVLDAEEKTFLTSIGYTEKEFFEFIEDSYAVAGDSLFWSRKAAMEGDVSAQSSLGYTYANGVGVPQDYVEAIIWYRKAAKHGEIGALTGLGYIYANGLGVPQDYMESAHWYWQAAEKGSDYAQLYLGHQYQHGQGIPRDVKNAIFWYRKAAEQGNSQALEELKKLGETL